MTAFGENLKRIRLDRKMTQDELAEVLDTSKQVISRYENGLRSPKVSTVAAFARALKVPIGALTGEADDDPGADALWDYREKLRRDPERRILFSLATNASIEDVRRAVAIIDALKKTDSGGDDPSQG